MKINIYLLSLLICSNTLAQSEEKIFAKAVYSIRYINPINGKMLIDDSCILNLSKSYSYFYSLGRDFAIQNLKKKFEEALLSNSTLITNASNSKGLRHTLTFTIFKKYVYNQVYMIEDIGEQKYGYLFDSTLTNRWIITTDSMTINGLQSKKALLKKDSSATIVWFSPDISISDGPLGYHGLPGIIVKSESSNGWYTEIKSFKMVENKLDVENKINFSVVSASEFKKAKKAYSDAFKLGNNFSSSEGTSIEYKKKN